MFLFIFLWILFFQTSNINSIDINDVNSLDSEPTARPSRGDILDDTFQDQVREPIPRGLPGAGRRRNDLDQSRSVVGSSEYNSNDERDEVNLDKHFAALPEDKHAPLQSGDARIPYHFHSEEDKVTLSERAYDRVLLDIVVLSNVNNNNNEDQEGKNEEDTLENGDNNEEDEKRRRLNENSNEVSNNPSEEEEKELAPEPMLTNEHLREWALFTLNPDLVHLSEAEMEVFDESFTAFIKRQGFAPPAKVLIPRGFVSGWSSTAWLQDVSEELKSVRIREEFLRKRREAEATEAIHRGDIENDGMEAVDAAAANEGEARDENEDHRRLFHQSGDASNPSIDSTDFAATDLFGDVVDSLGI
jgi:hypothetical protein